MLPRLELFSTPLCACFYPCPSNWMCFRHSLFDTASPCFQHYQWVFPTEQHEWKHMDTSPGVEVKDRTFQRSSHFFFFNVEHANGRAMSFCAWVPSSLPRGWALCGCSGSGGCLPPGLFPLWLVSLPPNKGTSFNSPSLLSTHPTYLLFPDLTLPTICSAYRHKVALLMLPRWFERGRRVMFRDSHSIQETITSLECPLVTESFTLSVWRSGFRGFLPPAVRLYNQSL